MGETRHGGVAADEMTGIFAEGLPRVALFGSVLNPFPGVSAQRLDSGNPDLAACDIVVAASTDPHLGALVRQAKGGPAVVVLDPDGEALGDLVLSSEAGGRHRWLAPAIDPLVSNPIGWRRRPTLSVAVLPTGPNRDLARWLADQGSAASVVLGPEDKWPRRGLRRPRARSMVSRDEAELADRLKRFATVVHHPGWYVDGSSSVRRLLVAAAAGTPIVAVDDPLLDELGLPVTVVADGDLMTAARAFEEDPDLRERASVRARRVALWRHSGRARLDEVAKLLELPAVRPPLVSVLLASNRPDMIDHGIRSVAGQRYPAVELVLILHGEEFTEPPSIDRLELPVQVVRVGSDRALGEALNAGLEVARGELVAKMDDDDLYGRDHLLDLVLALQYSGADLVGKRIDHVYLRDRDVTLVRRRSNPERDRRHVGGPTLMLRTSLLREHGFAPAPARVDTLLQDQLREEGRRVYGTHSLDVVLHRHGANTWTPDIERMLAEAEHTATGLDLSRAAVEPEAFEAGVP